MVVCFVLLQRIAGKRVIIIPWRKCFEWLVNVWLGDIEAEDVVCALDYY